jgi:hypothetical protein
MSFVVTETAHLRAAAFTFPNLAARFISLNMVGFDPLPTSSTWAVYTILCSIFLKLSIPRFLESLVEELVDVFQGDVIRRAATWWHVCWIRD